MSHSYKDLIVWQTAWAAEIHRITEAFPKAEVYGLTSQMRRALDSVASNIAEGQGRLTQGAFPQFLGQPRGSLLELETQVAIAVDLHYLSEGHSTELEIRTVEVCRLLNGLISSPRGKQAHHELREQS